MTIRVEVVPRGHGRTTETELATILDWERELFAPDRDVIDAFTWENKRGMGFNIQTYLDDEFVGFAHVFMRQGLGDETPILIGGLGGVMTAPQHQGRGIGARTVAVANNIIRRNFRADIGVLLCQPALVPFYENQKWRRMPGAVIAHQPDGEVQWPLAAMILLPQQDAAMPARLDLCGPPF